jgi:hypothetical protein
VTKTVTDAAAATTAQAQKLFADGTAGPRRHREVRRAGPEGRRRLREGRRGSRRAAATWRP